MATLFHYKEAQKLAQKEFRAATFKGEHPYPPALDNFVTDSQIIRGQDMGTFHIPMEFIIGTRTGLRTNAFARNFMPLMKENTEFAIKWDKLCQSQMEEGIREPILAYEYYNRYYVQEGNKRVSVLKFCGADTVYAHVIRVLPEFDESKEWEEIRYNELTKFIRYSGVNYLELSRPGYARLQQLVGKQPEEVWSVEDRREFRSIHFHFRKAYEALGGNKLTSTRGDALLAFIEVYGYPALRNSTEDQIKEMLEKAWEEITLQQEEHLIDLKLDPEEEKKPNLLTQVLSIGEKTKKVAFIHDGNAENSPWTRAHEQGREYVQSVLGDAIETTPYFDAMDNDPIPVMEQAIADGNTILFTTSAEMQAVALRCAIEHPNVIVLNCSQVSPHRYIRTYDVRVYEAKFVLGAIAGALSDDNMIGYVERFDNEIEDKHAARVHTAAAIAGINAFALGAQIVNPRARVYLEWFESEGPQEAVNRLTERGIRLIYSRSLSDPSRGKVSLSLMTEDGQKELAAPVWNWGVYYETLLRGILDKSLQAGYEESNRAQNYYWGMSAGVVKVHCSEKLPDSTKNLAELLQDNIRSGQSHPFKGKIYTQTGKALDSELTMEQIMHMDWLAENIVGTLPLLEENK